MKSAYGRLSYSDGKWRVRVPEATFRVYNESDVPTGVNEGDTVLVRYHPHDQFARIITPRFLEDVLTA